MIRAALVVILLAIAGPAAAASFDCGKARTKVEKMICADPELSRQDSELAAAYAQALKVWDGKIAAFVKINQRGWVAARGLAPPDKDMGGLYCVDDEGAGPCLRQIHDDRILVLKSPGFRLSGVYARGQDFVSVRAVRTGLMLGYALADASATQGFTDDTQPIDIAPGQTAVTFPVTGDSPCELDAVFTADAMMVNQKGPCSGAKLSGRWTRDQARDPEAELF